MSELRQILYIRDGGVGERQMVLGTVEDVVKEIQGAQWADYDITGMFGLDQMGELKPLHYEVRGVGKFDDNDMSYPYVTVHFPDGDRETAVYTVDGRA